MFVHIEIRSKNRQANLIGVNRYSLSAMRRESTGNILISRHRVSGKISTGLNARSLLIYGDRRSTSCFPSIFFHFYPYSFSFSVASSSFSSVYHDDDEHWSPRCFFNFCKLWLAIVCSRHPYHNYVSMRMRVSSGVEHIVGLIETLAIGSIAISAGMEICTRIVT